MVNRVLLKKLWRDLMHRRGALLALVLIVMVGIGLFVAMRAVYRDLVGARERYYRDYRLADFYVDLKRAPEWAVDEVAGMPNVRSVRGRVFFGVRTDVPGVDDPISGTAISMPVEPVPVLNDIMMRSGGWFSHEDAKEVILNDAFASANGLRPGHRIKVLLLDKEHDMLVVGTAMSPEFVYLMSPDSGMVPDPQRFGVMYAPERFLQEACDLDGAYNQLIGLVHDDTDIAVDNTMLLIQDRLDVYGVTNTTPSRDQPSVRFLSDEIKGLEKSSTIMPSIFCGVAALVLNVLMGRIVVQQRTVIGTLMALGYSSGSVLRHYLGFGAIIGLVGGTAGVVFGKLMQGPYLNLYLRFYKLPATDPGWYPDVLLFGLAVSVLFAVAGTIRGVREAARLEPAEAMRPPPPEKGGHVLPEQVPAFWAMLPFRWKMITRAVFRNPFRSTVSLLASMISTALVLSAVCMMDCMDYMIAYEFERMSRYDFTVSLRDPQGRNGPPEVGSLPTTAATEPQLLVACDLSNGPYRKRLGVIGLPQNNRLYTPLDESGQPIVVPDAGLVLARKVAEMLDVQPGERVRLRPLIARRQEVVAPVVGIVDTFMGLSAYADISYLSRLLGEEWSANVILGRSFRGSSRVPFLDKLKERPTVLGIGERTRALTQLDETMRRTMGTMLGIMVLFAGLIAFGSVLNAALVSLSERRREVGTLRVIGYTPLDTTRIFSGESYLLNGVGVVLGLVAGVGLLYLLARAYDTELYRFPIVIYPLRHFQTAVIMLVFITFAQLIIYRSIRKMDWLSVMKTKE